MQDILRVEEGETGRLDVWLVGRVVAAGLGEDGFSRARGQILIKEGYVALETDGGWEKSLNPAKKVRAGEVYRVEIPPVAELEVVGEAIPLEILFEDGDLLVVNKPAGLAVHPAPGNWTGTLVHALVHHCGEELSGINGVARPGIVHRLDKDTSGILVVAKTDKAHRGLAKQLANHSMHRVYEAICAGVPLPRRGTVDTLIGRNPHDRMKRAVIEQVGGDWHGFDKGTGKRAVTHYRVLETFGDVAARVELQLETGRTHQIRVHMAHLKHPLLGDPMYGPRRGVKGLNVAALNLNRQMLHARELGFIHPVTKDEMMFEAEAPEDMVTVAELLRDMAGT